MKEKTKKRESILLGIFWRNNPTEKTIDSVEPEELNTTKEVLNELKKSSKRLNDLAQKYAVDPKNIRVANKTSNVKDAKININGKNRNVKVIQDDKEIDDTNKNEKIR